MEQKKSFWDFGTQVLAIYGFTMIIMNIFCLQVGEDAKPFSSLFSLGGGGLSAATSFQLFGLSVLIALCRMIFFTDVLIKKMSIAARTVGMLATVILIVVVFVAVFGWFPAGEWRCWLMFLLCFGVSFVVSLGITILKERTENRQMEEALEKMQREEITERK